jgi:hypothetical protein
MRLATASPPTPPLISARTHARTHARTPPRSTPFLTSGETVITQVHRELADEQAQKQRMISELGMPHKESPLGQLQAALQQLGSQQASPEELTRRWHSARTKLREARGSLAAVSELRERAQRLLPPTWARHIGEARPDPKGGGRFQDPLPREARRLWAAVAAREAMARDYRAIAGTDSGAAGAVRRLLGQRHAAVQELVVAVAQYALRRAMSAETCAGLVRLVSAVAAAVSQNG